jgi:hypothetical protein
MGAGYAPEHGAWLRQPVQAVAQRVLMLSCKLTLTLSVPPVKIPTAAAVRTKELFACACRTCAMSSGSHYSVRCHTYKVEPSSCTAENSMLAVRGADDLVGHSSQACQLVKHP